MWNVFLTNIFERKQYNLTPFCKEEIKERHPINNFLQGCLFISESFTLPLILQLLRFLVLNLLS